MIQIQVNPDFVNDNMEWPKYAHEGDAGMDVRANIVEAMTLYTEQTLAIPTGLSVKLPDSHSEDWVWELQVRPRSGLALNHNITVQNSPGTVDMNYTGEIQIILHNASDISFRIVPGMKIAQLVLAKAYTVDWYIVDKLPETTRGSQGFGSSGT